MFDFLYKLLDDPAFKAKVKYNLRHFKTNEKILEQGKPHRCLYLIKSGKVRVIVRAAIKDESPIRPGIAELGENDVFGEFGLFDDHPASADIIAIDDSVLIEIDIKTFKTFLDANPEIGYQVLVSMLNKLASRLRRADKTIFTLYSWGMKAHKLNQFLE